jgi:hypothetical protein
MGREERKTKMKQSEFYVGDSESSLKLSNREINDFMINNYFNKKVNWVIVGNSTKK